MSRYLIIFNPIAGAGTALKAQPGIRELLTRSGLDFTITQTEYPGHATGLARQAAEDGYDYVISAGGDGTSIEVLNGLMQHKENGGALPVMGVLPVGRGNDFAFGAGIPHNVDQACALLATLPKKYIDIGKVTGGDYPEGLYFGNGVGIGFDAAVSFIASKMKMKGMLSYLVAALQTIFIYYKSPTLSIRYADEVQTLPALMVSVMNGKRMGGGFMMAPAASMTDGMFSITMVNEVPQIAMLGLILKFMRGTHLSHPAVKTIMANKIIVTALKGTLPVHADGNQVCEKGHEITVELLPRALELIS